MTIQVTTRTEDRVITGRFPARITIDGDHISVSTSFGYGNHELSVQVHEEIVRAVRAEIIDGFGDEDRLIAFSERVYARALQDKDEEGEDLLGEERI